MADVSTDGGESFLEFDLDTVTTDEAIELEDTVGLVWLDFLKGLEKGSAKSMRGLVWLARHRDDPTVKVKDVTFDMTKFVIRDGEEPGPLSEESESSSSSSEPSSPSSSESSPGSGST